MPMMMMMMMIGLLRPQHFLAGEIQTSQGYFNTTIDRRNAAKHMKIQSITEATTINISN
jgi:hypothetical protein